MGKRFRVIRVLEYTYETAEAAAEDMGRWGVPPQGVEHYGKIGQGQTIRSGVTLLGPVEDDDE